MNIQFYAIKRMVKCILPLFLLAGFFMGQGKAIAAPAAKADAYDKTTHNGVTEFYDLTVVDNDGGTQAQPACVDPIVLNQIDLSLINNGNTNPAGGVASITPTDPTDTCIKSLRLNLPLSYDPGAGKTVTQTFKYWLNTQQSSDAVTDTITLKRAAPKVSNQTVTTSKNATVEIVLSVQGNYENTDLLGNLTQASPNHITIKAAPTQQASPNGFIISPDSTNHLIKIDYTPSASIASYPASDVFTYTVTEDGLVSDLATVSITIIDTPYSCPDSYVAPNILPYPDKSTSQSSSPNKNNVLGGLTGKVILVISAPPAGVPDPVLDTFKVFLDPNTSGAAYGKIVPLATPQQIPGTRAYYVGDYTAPLQAPSVGTPLFDCSGKTTLGIPIAQSTTSLTVVPRMIDLKASKDASTGLNLVDLGGSHAIPGGAAIHVPVRIQALDSVWAESAASYGIGAFTTTVNFDPSLLSPLSNQLSVINDPNASAFTLDKSLWVDPTDPTKGTNPNVSYNFSFADGNSSSGAINIAVAYGDTSNLGFSNFKALNIDNALNDRAVVGYVNFTVKPAVNIGTIGAFSTSNALLGTTKGAAQGTVISSQNAITTTSSIAPAYFKVEGVFEDLDGDGKLTINDIIQTIKVALGVVSPVTSYTKWAADANGDGIINIFDVVKMVHDFLFPTP